MTMPRDPAWLEARAAQKEEIRQRIDFPALAARYLKKVKRSGNGLRAVCPFHQGAARQSFAVYPDSFTCFQCGIGGDLFSFIGKIENKSFSTVLNELAAQAGVTLHREDRSAPLPENGVAFHLVLTWWRTVVQEAKQAAQLQTPPAGLEAHAPHLGLIESPHALWMQTEPAVQAELTRRGFSGFPRLAPGWVYCDPDADGRTAALVPITAEGTLRGPVMALEPGNAMGVGMAWARTKARDTSTLLVTRSLASWWRWAPTARTLGLPLVAAPEPTPFGSTETFRHWTTVDPVVLDLYFVYEAELVASQDQTVHDAAKRAVQAGARPLGAPWVFQPDDHPDAAWATLHLASMDVVEWWVELLQVATATDPLAQRIRRAAAKLGPILAPLLLAPTPAHRALAESYTLWIARALGAPRQQFVSALMQVATAVPSTGAGRRPARGPTASR